MIENRHLWHALTLAKHRNFARAAKALNMTQPTLSRNIQALEQELGVTLFDRRPRDVVPTTFGELLLRRGEAIFDSLEGLRHEIDGLRGLEAGVLIVGAGPAGAGGHLGPALGRMAERHPNVRVQVVLRAFPDLLEGMRKGQVDIVLGGHIGDIAGDATFDVVPVAMAKGFFFCRRGHPLLRKKQIRLEELRKQPIIGPYLPRTVIEWLYPDYLARIQEPDIPPFPHTIQCNDYFLIKAIVAQSNVIGGGPYSVIAHDVRTGLLSILDVEEFPRNVRFGVVRIRDRQVSPAAQAFIDCVLEADEWLSRQYERLNLGDHDEGGSGAPANKSAKKAGKRKAAGGRRR
jgi:DNA-binding transcriptional LysR family regulator